MISASASSTRRPIFANGPASRPGSSTTIPVSGVSRGIDRRRLSGGGSGAAPTVSGEMAAPQIPILRRCDPAEVAEHRSRNEFFWADLGLADGIVAADIAQAFGVSEAAAGKLVSFRLAARPRIGCMSRVT